MASNLFEPGTSAAAHVNPDTDRTAEALHHTVGRGPTQAAAGNHKHKYTEILEVPPPQNLTHNHDSAYSPVTHSHTGVFISGPHGPLNTYEQINHIQPDATPYSIQLHHDSTIEGWTLLTVHAYLQVRGVVAYSKASLSAYLSPYGRWHDYVPVNWRNGQVKSIGRLTVVKPVDYGYTAATAQAWFENRPGMRGSFGGQGAVQDAYDNGAVASMGALRITLEIHPYAGTPNDGAAWGAP